MTEPSKCVVWDIASPQEKEKLGSTNNSKYINPHASCCHCPAAISSPGGPRASRANAGLSLVVFRVQDNDEIQDRASVHSLNRVRTLRQDLTMPKAIMLHLLAYYLPERSSLTQPHVILSARERASTLENMLPSTMYKCKLCRSDLKVDSHHRYTHHRCKNHTTQVIDDNACSIPSHAPTWKRWTAGHRHRLRPDVRIS